MAFSNKGPYVSPGIHVTAVISGFRAEGLVVEGSCSGSTDYQLLGGSARQRPKIIEKFRNY